MSAAIPPPPSSSAFRNPDFAKLWTAATISLFGTQVSQIAIPVIAVLVLKVPPFQVAGQPVGGSVVGLFGAPFAVVLDAISYVVSAVLIFAIRRRERASRAGAAATAVAEEVADTGAAGASVAAELAAARSEARDERPGLRRQVAEGLRFVLDNRYLRSIAASTGTSNLFSNI